MKEDGLMEQGRARHVRFLLRTAQFLTWKMLRVFPAPMAKSERETNCSHGTQSLLSSSPSG